MKIINNLLICIILKIDIVKVGKVSKAQNLNKATQILVNQNLEQAFYISNQSQQINMI